MIISWFEARVRKNVKKLLLKSRKKPLRRRKDPTTHLDLLPDEAQKRFIELHAWRKSRASARGIPPYRIFNNRTLLHLSVKNPLTAEELTQINGIKEKRAKDYGEEILSLLKKQPLQ